MSLSVWFSAWPICKMPVTFGGGSTIVYVGASGSEPGTLSRASGVK